MAAPQLGVSVVSVPCWVVTKGLGRWDIRGRRASVLGPVGNHPCRAARLSEEVLEILLAKLASEIMKYSRNCCKHSPAP